MSNEKLVSVIIPCYNGEKFLNRCLDSLVNQSYKNIELIIVNDGSNDQSENIIKTRLSELKDSLRDCKYFYQKNQGVGAAVNRALKFFNGEYITLLDVDDYLMPNSIEVKVKWMEKNPDYAVVFTNGYYVNEKTFFSSDKLFYSKEKKWIEDAFTEIIKGNLVNWPGSYMIRSKTWLKRCPDREIFVSRSGQNMQMLLPATYHERTGFIDVPLMRYLVQEVSLSHFNNDSDGDKRLKASRNYQEIYLNVTKRICDSEELEAVHRQINEMFSRSRLQLASSLNNKKEIEINYKQLKRLKCNNINDMILYYKNINKFFYNLLRIVRKIVLLSKRDKED